MTDNLDELIKKYKDKGIFIDSELLIFYIVCKTDIRLLGKTKITKQYDENDYLLISELVEVFNNKTTSPHILTETSDLLGEDNDFHATLREEYINSAVEKSISSVEIATSKSFPALGLADSAIIEISKDSYLVSTDDNDLYGYLSTKGIDAIKFSYLKQLFR